MSNRPPRVTRFNLQEEAAMFRDEEGGGGESSRLASFLDGSGDAATTSAATTSSQTTTSAANSFITNTFGRVVNPFIQVVDVDGVMRRIDVNDVMTRVNWNDVIDDIDWNNLMEHIDVDALMDRIDVNAVVERIDVNAVIERSNLKSIIARSTTGICFLALDSIRAMCIKGDQHLQRWGRCADCFWWRSDYKKWVLPPLPTVTPISRARDRRDDRKLRASMECPRKSSHLAIAVQGRNAGVCSRFCAFSIDKGLTVGFAFLFMLMFAELWNAIPDSEPESTEYLTNPNAAAFVGQELQSGNITLVELRNHFDTLVVVEDDTQQGQIFFIVGIPMFIVFIIGFITDAFCLMVIGRTVGKVIMGLVVLDSHGGKIGHLTICQSISRSLFTNAGLFTVIGALVSMSREDRRGVIDLICGTTVVYAWDAKRFRLAEDDFASDMPFGDLDFHRRKSFGSGGHDAVGAPYLRHKSFRGKKNQKDKHKTETIMISVPAAAMMDHQGRANRINRASDGTSPSSRNFDA